MKKYKIGIFGSAVKVDKEIQKKAEELGRELNRHNVILITGVASGLPYIVVSVASRKGSEVIGFSPTIDRQTQQKETPEQDLSLYQKLVFIPKNFPFVHKIDVCRKYRNVISTANCDAAIIISGRWGTMNEFTNLYDMGKIIGVLTKTGGVADELPNLLKKISKKTKAKIILEQNPRQLVDKIIREFEKQQIASII